MTDKDPRVNQTEMVKEYTERLRSLWSSPPTDWDAWRKLSFVKDVILLVGKCPNADEGVVTSFVDVCSRMVVLYTQEDERNRRRTTAQSA